ncbi:hypothetical protein Ae201684_007172 [Aphanomyces euteiches]|uniref:Uncharacterized protein n=1 Tax=Aphanomyces euteiches TaxID=100861 RepID=A0A6G0X9H4_9STRA|nr:hypothetical protein Ae201684_007172 [Aphanomyces euteiches]KAH9155489.1 hypothetical protein AeRB84_002533 [Aphanomyces euteiches]
MSTSVVQESKLSENAPMSMTYTSNQDEEPSVIPIAFASRLLSCVDRQDQWHLKLTSAQTARDLECDEVWELVGLERFRLPSSCHGQWLQSCTRRYQALNDAVALCTYMQRQNVFSLSYINRDIKERIQDQLLSIIDLTSSGLDIVSRIYLAQRGVVKHLGRLLGSNTMAISDLACAALANFVCVLSSKDESTIRAQLIESVEQVRGTRGLKELLLSPLVSESGPGPTKHAARVFINMLFPQHQVICQVRDVWEGYILTEPALRPSVDEDLDHLKQLDGVWDISYRHCSGQDYNHLVIETAATPRGDIHGSGRDNKGQSIKLTGTLTSKPGVHNCEFSVTFDNQGKPYGPRPILHIGFWSSLHRDRIWGVWEVRTSPDQHKLGTGGIFLIKVQQAQTSQGQ